MIRRVMPAETDLGPARLVRWHHDLARGLAEAYAAAEDDLRQWMPSASVEQEDAVSFVAACVTAFEAGRSYAYAILVEEVVIGYCNLTPDVAEPSIGYVGYWVRPEYRRLGIASAAAGWLAQTAFSVSPPFAQVHAFVDGANRRSHRVLEKAGFELRRPGHVRHVRHRSRTPSCASYKNDRARDGMSFAPSELQTTSRPDRNGESSVSGDRPYHLVLRRGLCALLARYQRRAGVRPTASPATGRAARRRRAKLVCGRGRGRRRLRAGPGHRPNGGCGSGLGWP